MKLRNATAWTSGDDTEAPQLLGWADSDGIPCTPSSARDGANNREPRSAPPRSGDRLRQRDMR